MANYKVAYQWLNVRFYQKWLRPVSPYYCEKVCQKFLMSQVALCSIPHQIISDNAQQFKVARTTFNKAWSNAESEYAVGQGIQWKFIVELAPWMGGFYERMVGLTKRSLQKTTEKQLVMILAEVEAVINSHPLVYVDDDNHDINSELTLTLQIFCLCTHIMLSLMCMMLNLTLERNQLPHNNHWRYGNKVKDSWTSFGIPGEITINLRKPALWSLEGRENFGINQGKRSKG